jgi:chitinase
MTNVSQHRMAYSAHMKTQFDPASFAVIPSDPADEYLMKVCTALKRSDLEAWLAIGGYDFSDPGATRTAWSDMASSQENRAAFISSLKDYLDKFGFQGVEIGTEITVFEVKTTIEI